METYDRIDKVLSGNLTKEELEVEYAFLAREYVDLAELNMDFQRAVEEKYGAKALKEIQVEAVKSASEKLDSKVPVDISQFREIPKEAVAKILELGKPVYGLRDEEVTFLSNADQISFFDSFQMYKEDADSQVCQILFDVELGLK